MRTEWYNEASTLSRVFSVRGIERRVSDAQIVECSFPQHIYAINFAALLWSSMPGHEDAHE